MGGGEPWEEYLEKKKKGKKEKNENTKYTKRNKVIIRMEHDKGDPRKGPREPGVLEVPGQGTYLPRFPYPYLVQQVSTTSGYIGLPRYSGLTFTMIWLAGFLLTMQLCRTGRVWQLGIGWQAYEW